LRTEVFRPPAPNFGGVYNLSELKVPQNWGI